MIILDHSYKQIGIFKDYLEVKILHKLEKGDKELTFFIAKGLDNLIAEECFIEFNGQRYCVKEIEENQGDKKVTCLLDIEELKNTTFEEIIGENDTIADLLTRIPNDTGWTFEVVNFTKRRTMHLQYANWWNLITEIIKVYTCEIEIDSINKIVTFKERIGLDRGAFFIEGLNIEDITSVGDSYDLYTRIIPLGAGDMNISTINGGKIYLDNFQYIDKIKTFYWRDNRYTDLQQLKEDALIRLEAISKPNRSINVQVKNLASLSSEYSHLAVNVGDIITLIIDGQKFKHRVLTYTEYPTNPSEDEIEISNNSVNLRAYLQDRENDISTLNLNYEKISVETGKITTAVQKVEKDLANQSEWIESAKQEITPDAITNTVTSSQKWKEDVLNYIYAKGTGFDNKANRKVEVYGNVVIDNADRGLNVIVVHKDNKSILLNKTYDTYKDESLCEILLEDMRPLKNQGHIIIVTSYDSWKISIQLQTELCDLGAYFGEVWDENAENIINPIHHRSALALIGKQGIGKGNGFFVFHNGSAGKPYAEVTCLVKNGSLSGGANNANTYIGDRIYEVESKTTSTAIVNTVRQSQSYKDDLGNKVETTEFSKFIEKYNSFEWQIGQSGATNILFNGRFLDTFSYWWEHEYDCDANNKSRNVITPNSDWCLDGRNTLQLRGTNSTKGHLGMAQTVVLKKNTTYTVCGWSASHRCKYYAYVQRASGDWWVPNGIEGQRWGGKDPTQWDFWSYTFTTDEGLNSYNFHFSATDFGNDGYAWHTDVAVIEGSIKTPWIPNQGEAYGSNMTLTGEKFKIAFDNGTSMEVNRQMPLTLIDGNTNRTYHALSETGYTVVGGYIGTFPPAVTVQLPNLFKGKTFQVSVMVQETKGGIQNSEWVQKIKLDVENLDYANGRFTIRGAWWSRTTANDIFEKELGVRWTATA